MTKIDDKLILKLEQLARLQLEETERPRIRKDLNNILDMVDKLEELDVDGVEPLIYLNEEVNVFRKDIVQGQVTQMDAFKNAPDSKEDFFRIPKVVGK